MRRQRFFRDTVGLGGWLFADLMLALAMLFFAANTRGEPPPLPRITGFTPISGFPGDRVTIRGENFSGAEALRFANMNAAFSVVSPSEVISVVPRDAVTGPISLTTANGLATSPTSFTVSAEPSATPTATLVPTATPIPSPTPCVRTVILEKHVLVVDAGPGGGAPSDDQLRATFAPFAGLRAGLILTFGRNATPGPGEVLARAINARLRGLLPSMFGPDAIMEGYHALTPPYNSAEFNAYFFNEGCA